MHARHLPAFEYRRMRWKNNLGWTREIHVGAEPGAAFTPDGDAPWAWRVSIAEIDHDCPFSAFPGHDRVLVLLSGNGMRLRFDDAREVELLPPHGRIAFRGEDALHCELLDGPTRDFNLIWDRRRVRATLMHRPLVGPMVFFADPRVQWLVHLIGGRAQLKDRADVAPLDAGDSLLLHGDEGGARAILAGGGELLLARVESAA
jgi:environmental stress-induced protein Ves